MHVWIPVLISCRRYQCPAFSGAPFSAEAPVCSMLLDGSRGRLLPILHCRPHPRPPPALPFTPPQELLQTAAAGRRLTTTLPSSSSCDPLLQRAYLVTFFAACGGPNWTQSTGFPDITSGGSIGIPLATLLLELEAVPVQTGRCSSQQQVPQQQHGDVTVLPDHCCWYGVSCCIPQTCIGDPYCNCTIGLVTRLSWGSNNVRTLLGSEEEPARLSVAALWGL